MTPLPHPAPKRSWLTFSLRTFLVVTLGVALALGYIGRARLAAERERQMRELIARSFSNSAWVERPKVIGKPTAHDAAARKELLELLEEKQDPEFRRDYRIVVPEHGTGLPRDYEVLVYGEYAHSNPSRLQVSVRDGKAIGELATDDEFRRGELPADVVDNLVRQLAYGYIGENVARNTNSFDSATWSTYASHAPQTHIEVYSQTPNSPFLLKTEPWQLIAHDVSSHTAGVYGYSHTRFAEALAILMRKELPALGPTAELKREVVRRLKAITPPANGGREDDSLDADRATMPLDYYRRDDLLAVEATIYSRLAVAWRVPEALSELRRLDLRTEEAQLAIAVADQPDELLYAALTGEDWTMFRFALEFATTPPTPERVGVLLRSLPRALDAYRQEEILASLEDIDASPEQIDIVGQFHIAAQDARSRIAAARFLLGQTDGDVYYEELTRFVLNPPDAQLGIHALDSLVSFSRRTKRRNEETLVLVRSEFDQGRGYVPTLASYLGQIGNREDVPRLVARAEKEGEYECTYLIEAVARLDAASALPLVRAKIQAYLDDRGNSSFRWNVWPYDAILFWQHDQHAIELLEQAVKKMQREMPDPASWTAQFELMLKYLRAESASERLPLALEYVRSYPIANEPWLADVGRELLTQGGDPAACNELLKAARKLK